MGSGRSKLFFFTAIQVFICHDAAMAVAHTMVFLIGVDVIRLDMKFEGTNRRGYLDIPQKRFHFCWHPTWIGVKRRCSDQVEDVELCFLIASMMNPG